LIHANAPAFSVDIEKQFLYDMDERYAGQAQRGTVFGISSYPGEALTLQVLLDDGSMFSYIPLHAISSKPVRQPLELSDLVYKNCPGPGIEITAYDHLKGEVSAYFRKKDLWLGGRYLFTIDWYEDNEQFHMIELENGQYAALPNHKVKFKDGPRSFEPYKKSHQTWRA
jgi:hypothetical protein